MGSLNTSQVVVFVLVDITIILIAARLVGNLFRRLGQPRVVGEIVAGILLGPTLLGATLWPEFVAPAWMHCADALAGGDAATPTLCLFPPQSRVILGNIGQIALLIFSFLVGLEVDVDFLKGKMRSVLSVGLGVVGLPVALGLAVGPALNADLFRQPGASALGFALFTGSMLAVSALPVMVRILQEKKLTTSHMGAVGIASAAVTTIAMFMVVSIATSVSTGQSAGAILAKIALTFLYLIVMAAVVRPLLDRAARSYRDSGVLGSGLFAILFITLTASGVFAELLGLTVMVGGFVAGMVLPARKQLFADMEERVGELTGTILLPIFLAFSGLGTDFTRLSGPAFSGLAILLIAAIAAKWVGGAVFARLSGLSWAEGNVLGILMNCRGLMVLVVALAGVQNGVITPVMQLGGVLIALITTAMTGPLFDRYIGSIPEAHDPRMPTIETAGPG